MFGGWGCLFNLCLHSDAGHTQRVTAARSRFSLTSHGHGFQAPRLSVAVVHSSLHCLQTQL